MGVYYEYERPVVNQTEPTFIKVEGFGYSIKTHKDNLVKNIIQELITFIVRIEKEKGIKIGKTRMQEEIKELLNID